MKTASQQMNPISVSPKAAQVNQGMLDGAIALKYVYERLRLKIKIAMAARYLKTAPIK
jgi:hypothetical protein